MVDPVSMLGPGSGISWGLESTTAAAAAAAAADDDDVSLWTSALSPAVIFAAFDVGFITSLHPQTVNQVTK